MALPTMKNMDFGFLSMCVRLKDLNGIFAIWTQMACDAEECVGLEDEVCS